MESFLFKTFTLRLKDYCRKLTLVSFSFGDGGGLTKVVNDFFFTVVKKYIT